MATPGSSTKINAIAGISQIMQSTSDEEATFASAVYHAGIIIKKSDGKLYLTDGVKTFANLTPIVDTAVVPLSAAAATAVNKSFGEDGKATNAEGAFVVLGADGKISDDRLSVVDGGKIVASYLSDIYDEETGKLKLDVVPDVCRAHLTYVATYAELPSEGTADSGLYLVLDASGDPTVDKGAATYAYRAETKEWIKIAEAESLDVDYGKIECSETNVEAAGAVMYKHTVELTAPTLTQYASLLSATGA